MYKFTSLARPLDFEYQSNRFIAYLALTAAAAGAIFQLATGALLWNASLWGLEAGLFVFLTWAISREIDPEFSSSAALVALLSFAAYYAVPKPSLGVSFWFLIASRLLNRSTGVNPKTFDYLTFSALSIWQIVESSALYGILGCIVLVLDYILGNNKIIPAFCAALLLIFASVWWFATNQRLQLSLPDIQTAFILLIIAFLYLLVVLRSRTVTAACDVSEDLLSPLRVQTCQVFIFSALLLGLFLLGSDKVSDFSPIFFAIVGVSIFNLAQLLKNRIDRLDFQ